MNDKEIIEAVEKIDDILISKKNKWCEDFILDCQDFYTKKGCLTEKQMDAIDNIYRKINE